MNGVIAGLNWKEAEPMKYWSPTAGTSLEKRKAEVKNAVFGGEYIAALKVDGFYERLVIDEDGEISMIARSRNVDKQVVDKIDWVPHLKEWAQSLPKGTCLLCECYIPGVEGSKNVTSILGCLKEKAIMRQKDKPLHFYVFDCMAYNGENYDKTAYEVRAAKVRELAELYPSPYVEYAEWFEGKELWTKLQEYLASGREGIVLMRKDAKVYFKRTPAHISIKVKKELQDTIDVFFTGKASAPTILYTGKEIETWPYWRNSVSGELLPVGPHYVDREIYHVLCEPVTKNFYNHYAGSLEIGVMKDGAVYGIGWLSNLSEEIKANYKAYKGRCIEVSAMQFDDETHALRHGKMIGFRDDLTPEDCTYEKYMGNE